MALMVSGEQDLDGLFGFIGKGLKAVGGVGSAIIGGATGAAVEGGIRAGKKALGIGGGRRRPAPVAAPAPVVLTPPPARRRRRPTPLYKRVEVVVPVVLAVLGFGYAMTRKPKRGA